MENKETIENNIRDMLLADTDNIVKKAMEDIVESMKQDISYTARNEIQKIVSDFVVCEVVPEMKKHLNENKDEIILSCVDAVSKTLAILGAKMVENAEKNLAYSYKADEIIKKMFM